MYNVDCGNIYIHELCVKFMSSSRFVYSLFNECYYDYTLLICDTNIKSGDIIFI